MGERGKEALSAGFGFRFAVFFCVPAVELFDAAGRIDKLLFAGVKRMTSRADVEVHRWLDCTGDNLGATSANDLALYIFWMYIFFHCL